MSKNVPKSVTTIFYIIVSMIPSVLSCQAPPITSDEFFKELNSLGYNSQIEKETISDLLERCTNCNTKKFSNRLFKWAWNQEEVAIVEAMFEQNITIPESIRVDDRRTLTSLMKFYDDVETKDDFISLLIDYSFQVDEELFYQIISNLRQKKDIKYIEMLLDKGKISLSTQIQGKSLIEHAVMTGTPDMVHWLVEKGIDYNSRTFQHAILKGKKDLFDALLETGAFPADYRFEDGTLPVNYGLKKNQSYNVEILIKQGFDINDETLYFALQNRYLYDNVEQLVETGFYPADFRLENGELPLNYAIEQQFAESAEILMNADFAFDENTPFLATEKGNMAALTYCIENGFDIQSTNNKGQSLLAAAIDTKPLIGIQSISRLQTLGYVLTEKEKDLLDFETLINASDVKNMTGYFGFYTDFSKKFDEEYGKENFYAIYTAVEKYIDQNGIWKDWDRKQYLEKILGYYGLSSPEKVLYEYVNNSYYDFKTELFEKWLVNGWLYPNKKVTVRIDSDYGGGTETIPILVFALQEYQSKVTDLLLEYGANPNVIYKRHNGKDYTPFIYAMEHSGGVTMFLDAGGDINLELDTRFTSHFIEDYWITYKPSPLAAAIAGNNVWKAQQLVEAGADPDIISLEIYSQSNDGLGFIESYGSTLDYYEAISILNRYGP